MVGAARFGDSRTLQHQKTSARQKVIAAGRALNAKTGIISKLSLEERLRCIFG
jgi:hypothetical protein